jgi:hypothetical protein
MTTTTTTATTEQAAEQTTAEELKATLKEFEVFMTQPSTPEEKQRAALIREWLKKK